MNGAAAMNRDTLKHVKIMYELYMEKYETACMYREHEKAIRYAGFYGALEQLLLGAKEHEFVQKIQHEVQHRRNEVVNLWRQLKG